MDTLTAPTAASSKRTGWKALFELWHEELLSHRTIPGGLTELFTDVTWNGGSSKWAEHVLDWYPREELPEFQQALLVSEKRGYGHPPQHYVLGRLGRTGVMDTVRFMDQFKDSPEDLATIFLGASIHPLLFGGSRSHSYLYTGKVRQLLYSLQDTMHRSKVGAPGWHHGCTQVLPNVREEDLTGTRSLRELVKRLARSHARLLDSYQLIRVCNTEFATFAVAA